MKKKGFTLVEVMVALAILAIILVALTQAAVVVIRNNAQLEHRKTALGLAESTINLLTTLPYTSSLLSDTRSDDTYLNSPSPDPSGNGKVYILDKNGDGAFSSSDINDSQDAEKGIDHPSQGIDYSSVNPIEKKGATIYYKIWGVKDLSNMKKITVTVYWFEGSSTRAKYARYVTLSTYKRRR